MTIPTPTAALVEEAETMAVRALDGTASREEKSALFTSLAAALRRAGAELARWKAEHERDLAIAERDEAKRDAEAYKRQTQEVSAKAIELTKEVCAKLEQAEAERDELRATVTRLNRRAQTAEAGVRDNVEASKAAGKSMGRALANAAADMYLRRAEKAEAERDAQHAEVLRLTGERDAAREGWQQEIIKGIARAQTVCDVVDALDEARAQVWGLICAGSNMAERKQHFHGLWETALEAGLKLERGVSELTATRDLLNEENARLRKERDATLAMETDTARRSSAEIDSLKVELNEARSETEDLNRRVAELHAQRDEARAQVWGLGCKVTNLRNALKRNEQQRRELGWRAASEEATMAEVVRLRFQSLHWFEENERHSKQMRDCLRQKFELTQETARLKAHIATLELLLRGGK